MGEYWRYQLCWRAGAAPGELEKQTLELEKVLFLFQPGGGHGVAGGDGAGAGGQGQVQGGAAQGHAPTSLDLSLPSELAG